LLFHVMGSISLHSGKSSILDCISKVNALSQSESLVAEALPLNEGPEEQVEDLLDVLRAQPAPVIHQ